VAGVWRWPCASI